MPKKKQEIFENPSDDELPTAEEVKDEPSKLPPKKPRKKRVMTEEQRLKCIENLKKGRAKALANRQRKKKLKEIEKEEKRKEEDKKIQEFEEKKKPKKEPVKDPSPPPSPEPTPPAKPKGRSNDDYEDEIKSLKAQLAEKSKPKPKSTPLPVVKEIDEPEELVDMNSIQKSKPAPPQPKKKKRACGVRGLSTLRQLNQFL